MSSPCILFLAGHSCTGKSSLGKALRDLMGLPWLFWEIDRVAPQMPTAALIEPGQVRNLSKAALREALAIQDRLLEANLRAICAYAHTGFHVIAELFLWNRRSLEIADRALGNDQPLVVELQCPIEVLESRERARGTTYLGTVRAELESEWLVPADLVLDSTKPTLELASEVSEWLAAAPSSSWSRNVGELV